MFRGNERRPPRAMQERHRCEFFVSRLYCSVAGLAGCVEPGQIDPWVADHVEKADQVSGQREKPDMLRQEQSGEDSGADDTH